VVIDDRDDFFPLLMLMTGVTQTIAAFFGHGVGAIAV
jgi:hypothetical protein